MQNLVMIPALGCDGGLYADILPRLSAVVEPVTIIADKDTLTGCVQQVLSMAFSVLLCITVTGGRPTLTRTVIAVSATQFALHALYSVQGASSAVVPAPVSHHHIAVDWSAATSSPMSYDGSMLIAHLLAVAVTVGAIRQGERALRAAIQAIRLAVGSVLPRIPHLAGRWPRRLHPAARREPRASTSLTLLSAMRHRGPPPGFAAA